MTSQSVAALGRQAPTVRHAPRVRSNSWEDVADVARAYGLVLDEWQENVLEASMGERSDGKWSTPRVGLSVPRQNGKGALIEARELAGLLVFGEQSIVHSAHQQMTARVGFDRIKAYFDNYDDLRRKVKSISTALMRENILLKSGQMLRFPARSRNTIRGSSPGSCWETSPDPVIAVVPSAARCRIERRQPRRVDAPAGVAELGLERVGL